MEFFCIFIIQLTSLLQPIRGQSYDGASQSLTEWPTDIPTDVTDINLRDNSLTYVDGGILSSLTNIVLIKLNFNDLRNLSGIAAVGGTLTDLEIRANSNLGPSFDENTFIGMTALKTIYMTSIGFSSPVFPIDILSPVANTLERITLDLNEIGNVNCKELYLFQRLISLHLYSCKVKVVSNLTCLADQLLELNLLYNDLTSLDYDIFQGFTVLNTLKVSGIDFMPSVYDARDTLSNLHAQNIPSLNISELARFTDLINIWFQNSVLEPYLFPDLRESVAKLKKLELYETNLPEIQTYLICPLTEITHLTFQISPDRQWPDLSNITCLNKLRTLTVTNGRIEFIPADFVTMFPSLQAIYLMTSTIGCMEKPLGTPAIRVDFDLSKHDCSCCWTWLLDLSEWGDMTVDIPTGAICTGDLMPHLTNTQLSALTPADICEVPTTEEPTTHSGIKKVSCEYGNDRRACLFEAEIYNTQGELIMNAPTSSALECAILSLAHSHSQLYKYDTTTGVCTLF